MKENANKTVVKSGLMVVKLGLKLSIKICYNVQNNTAITKDLRIIL